MGDPGPWLKWPSLENKTSSGVLWSPKIEPCPSEGYSGARTYVIGRLLLLTNCCDWQPFLRTTQAMRLVTFMSRYYAFFDTLPNAPLTCGTSLGTAHQKMEQTQAHWPSWIWFHDDSSRRNLCWSLRWTLHFQRGWYLTIKHESRPFLHLILDPLYLENFPRSICVLACGLYFPEPSDILAIFRGLVPSYWPRPNRERQTSMEGRPSAKCQNRFRVFAGFHQFPSFLKLGNPETAKPIAKLWFNQCFSCMT